MSDRAPHAYGERAPVIAGLSALFPRARHILGSATVDLETGDKPRRLVFSSDPGRWNRPILRDTERVPQADILLVESTYGGRMHAQAPASALAAVVREAVARDGALVVPAVAVGRTQELIGTLCQREDAGAIPSLPILSTARWRSMWATSTGIRRTTTSTCSSS
jgi:metallo-beta-lactamase family protein